MTPRSASGSRRSPSAVEPATSQKRTVTTFRTSRGASASSGAPQESQKRASSRFSAWQRVQRTVRRYYATSQAENSRSKCLRGRAPTTDACDSPSANRVTVGIESTP